MRRAIIVAVVLCAAVLACGTAGWQALTPDARRFVVPGATNVRVQRAGLGTHVVSYDYAQTNTAWDTLLDRQLRAARWLPPDFSGAPAQFSVYTYVNTSWFGTVWEEVNIQGNPHHPTIVLRRWLRLHWLPQYSISL
jgi:hypothetical protein